MIKEIKYNDNLYQIENINKEIEIIKKEQWKLCIWKGVNKMKNLVKGLKDRFELRIISQLEDRLIEIT